MNPKEVVYVGNVPKQATDQELVEFFKNVGKVIKVSFMRENRNDCRSKVAFVLFENELQALKACSFDQTILQWNRVVITLVDDERHFWAGYTVIVRNISFETNEEELYEAFGRYGMIEAVQIPNQNFAYVGYKEKSAAIAAQRLNKTTLGSTVITVQVLNKNVRVRLEDLDSFKTPRVYNELMDAKLKHNYTKAPITIVTPPLQDDDYDDDDEDNRVYDPITNQFYNKGEQPQIKRESSPDEMYEEDMHVPVPSPITWHAGTKDQTSTHSPDEFDLSNEELMETAGEIRRRDVKFANTGITPIAKASVRVENIPRDVYDEDVVKYFDQFGPIISVEIAVCLNCVFNKVYTVIFKEESTMERVIDCFMRRCEFSGVVCTVFTMRTDETLLEVPGQCVLVDYISNSITHEDVVDAFRGVGEVLYVKKTLRNNTPSVIHFRRNISFDRAKKITKIDGDTVKVVPFSQEAYRTFTTEHWKLKKASTPYSKKPLKNVRMMDIEMKEQTEQSKYMILRTVFNPNYNNPDPQRYTYEIVIYNCPARITLKELRRHFINVAFVTNMRHEQSRFDTNTWKVYASFSTYMDAFNAVRLKGPLQSFPIYKHMATEKPKLDALEVLLIEFENDDISVNKMHGYLISHGAVTFVDKISNKSFIAICREVKTAKKISTLRFLSKCLCKVSLYRDVINNQNAAMNTLSAGKETQQRKEAGSSSRVGPPIPMDEIIALQKRLLNDNGESRTSSRDYRLSSNNEWEQELDRGGESSGIHRRISVDMDLDNDEPEHFNNGNQPQAQFNRGYPRFERVDDLVFSNPPAPNEIPFGIPSRDSRFTLGWALGGPLHEPPAMVPPPVTRNVFMNEPVGLIAPPGCGILGGPLLIPNVTIHQIQPEVPAVPHEGDLRQYLAEKRNTRPRDIYDPTEELDRQVQSINSGQPNNSQEMENLESYIREKEREINRRLKLLDKQLTVNEQPEAIRKRSVSPTDRRAHDRIEQIREEKIKISCQMAGLRHIVNYKNTAHFVQLRERQSMLDREATEIQRQLEAKKLWLAERERSLSRERHGQEETRKPSRRSRSRSRNRTRGSRSKSRGRHTNSRDRGNRNRDRLCDTRRSRSRSFSRQGRRRSPSRERSRRHYNRSNNVSSRRPQSLLREMRQLGRPLENKHDHCLYVGNIADGVKNEELKATFDRYGRVVDYDFSLRDKYCDMYVEYHQREDAFKALEMNRVKICGKRLRVALNCRKPGNREGYSVIVEMPEPVPERDLYARFNGCGEIEFIWHYDDALIATITFERPESMLMALAVRELHNRIPIIVREYVESER
ncbi:uncharacterized protein LOC131676823 [Topomyia yanbarensis]|uniref:uncharacterized protein LOC131676823 n=1 Tax=Topomyia yanbarensis TaxID=2498891 RepID=UPI00273C1F44|nr:uncharacterized protein LOC131676823 [Topomyia yanbarensis]